MIANTNQTVNVMNENDCIVATLELTTVFILLQENKNSRCDLNFFFNL